MAVASPDDLQRTARAGLYIEPVLTTLIARSAKTNKESVNGWIRKACIRRLEQEGLIPRELLLALVEK